ncbi:hypothetical protein T02_11492 [Trichinella nativa]|uniref:Uncharacterized protein n=1 Tax=Trichinella nativa TaxID=6335 RepID=A0A0V1L3K7_9BILA|nr:hypothetical protein T02_11492 [Trichinella nativa]
MYEQGMYWKESVLAISAFSREFGPRLVDDGKFHECVGGELGLNTMTTVLTEYIDCVAIRPSHAVNQIAAHEIASSFHTVAAVDADDHIRTVVSTAGGVQFHMPNPRPSERQRGVVETIGIGQIDDHADRIAELGYRHFGRKERRVGNSTTVRTVLQPSFRNTVATLTYHSQNSVKYGFFQTVSSTGCVNLSIVELNTVSTKCNSTIYWPSVVVGFVVVVAVDQFDWFLVSEKNRYLLKKCDLVYLRRFQGKIAVPFREG